MNSTSPSLTMLCATCRRLFSSPKVIPNSYHYRGAEWTILQPSAKALRQSAILCDLCSMISSRWDAYSSSSEKQIYFHFRPNNDSGQGVQLILSESERVMHIHTEGEAESRVKECTFKIQSSASKHILFCHRESSLTLTIRS
jgi:hypothetical protein